ncbi:MAG: hypothetical protein HC815_38905 [Richelia sp. RM1_1_1]|nr:hypothetical protein [Richelia sp. RM1_1_1]
MITTDGTISSIWNTSGQKLSEFKVNQDIYNPSFSPDGKRIIAISTDNMAIIWDTNGKQLVEIPHQTPVMYAKFSPMVSVSSQLQMTKNFIFGILQVSSLQSTSIHLHL